MRLKPLCLAAVALVADLVLAGCAKPKEEITEQDRSLAAEIGLPEVLLAQAKGAGRNLHRLMGMDDEGSPTKAVGITVEVTAGKADAVARKLQATAPPGWMAFVSAQSFGIAGQPDEVSVLKADGYADVLRVMGTNGWNYDIGPEQVIARLKLWDQRFGIVLRGAGFDWLEASFQREPPDLGAFAREVYEFCPDVVEQGTETTEALAAEMRRTQTVYLWWD